MSTKQRDFTISVLTQNGRTSTAATYNARIPSQKSRRSHLKIEIHNATTNEQVIENSQEGTSRLDKQRNSTMVVTAPKQHLQFLVPVLPELHQQQVHSAYAHKRGGF